MITFICILPRCAMRHGERTSLPVGDWRQWRRVAHRRRFFPAGLGKGARSARRIRQALVSLGAALTLATLSCWAADDPAARVFAAVEPVILTVQGFNEQQEPESLGSGVSLGDGRVITNCHVVRDSETLKISYRKNLFTARWLLADFSRDLCLLQAEGLKAPAVRMAVTAHPAIGTAVYAVGNPLGLGLAVSEGLITNRTPDTDAPGLIFSAPISPGSSGGGLFDGDARLIGITSSNLRMGQNLNVARPAADIEILRKTGRPPPLVETRELTFQPPHVKARAVLAAKDWNALEAHARLWRTEEPLTPRAATYHAKALIGLNRPDEAERAVREALRLDSQDHLAWEVLAETHQRRAQHEAAGHALTRALSLFPHSDYAWSLRAHWAWDAGQIDAAEEAVRMWLKFVPNNADGWRLLGSIESKRGRNEAAAHAFRVALSIDPLNKERSTELAQMLARAGQPDASAQVIGRTKASADAETWKRLGDSEYQRGRYADAERAFRRAIELAPEFAQAWHNLGVVYVATHRYEEAMSAYERSIALEGETADVLNNRANLHRIAGRNEAAMRDWSRAIELDPKLGFAWEGIGNLHFDARKFREAADALRHAVEISPNRVAVLVRYGETLDRLGQRDDALKVLTHALTQDPKGVSTLNALAANRGNGGDFVRSLEYLEQALAIDSADAVVWSSKGFTLMRLNRLAEATAALETAVRLGPENANALINLGHVQLRNKNLNPSISALERAIKIAPDAIDARLYLAQAYFAARQIGKVREHVQVVLEKQANFAPALGLLTMTWLMENRANEARSSFARLKAVDARAAAALRSAAIAAKLPVANELPE